MSLKSNENDILMFRLICSFNIDLMTGFLTSSPRSPSVLVLRLLTPSRSITETFLISQPSSTLTQSSPGPRQSWDMKGILLSLLS